MRSEKAKKKSDRKKQQEIQLEEKSYSKPIALFLFSFFIILPCYKEMYNPIEVGINASQVFVSVDNL